MSKKKPLLSFAQIINMNFGFFGIQYSFGLQQSNMSPIYKYLGADEANLPLLWLAGPMTGLIVQPIIGAMSDKTNSKYGRRTPYFLIGAIVCSICLFWMPFSSSLWMAASLLWILDAANNISMEPYRAFIGDKLDESQHSLGFLTQSAFTGLGQTMAYITPTFLVVLGMDSNWVNGKSIPYITIFAFIIGAVCTLASILWTIWTTPENPLTEEEKAHMERMPNGIKATFVEIADAVREMPLTMQQLAIVKFFQWYGIFCYWQYIVLSISTTFYQTTEQTSQGFRDANLINGQVGAFYNLMAFFAAFAMVPVSKKIGAKYTHSIALVLGGIGMICIPLIDSMPMLLIPMLGIGICWASMMGNPYIMLAGCIPQERSGVYMGIFNMFIVIPMMIQIFTLPFYYNSLLDGNPENVIRLAGSFMICGAIAVLFVKVVTPEKPVRIQGGGGH